jgi:hypothetical protein
MDIFFIYLSVIQRVGRMSACGAIKYNLILEVNFVLIFLYKYYTYTIYFYDTQMILMRLTSVVLKIQLTHDPLRIIYIYIYIVIYITIYCIYYNIYKKINKK